MKRTIVSKLILGALCLAMPLTVFSEQRAQQGTAVPLRLEPTEIPYSRMRTDMPPWPDEDVLSGVSEHRYEYLYSGDINVAIYEAKPMKLRLEDYRIDEFVMVVSGTLILTADGGSPQRIEAGQSVLVPKGFTGTWEMQGNFREMVVMMNKPES